MAEKEISPGSGVQDLIARIRDQGVSAGQEEADRLLQEAQQQAARIVREAREEAEALKQTTEARLTAEKEAALEALKLAARDAGLELQGAVIQAFERQVQGLVSDTTMDTEFLKQLILVLAGHSVDEFVQDKDVRIFASNLLLGDDSDPEFRERAERATLALSSDMLRQGIELVPARNVEGGVRVQVVDDNLEIDLTSDAVSRLLLVHLLPRFRNLLSGAE
jgi:V/A-type H+-transporting ATPase subunit E